MAASYVHCYLSIMYRKIGHSQIQNRPLGVKTSQRPARSARSDSGGQPGQNGRAEEAAKQPERRAGEGDAEGELRCPQL